MDYSNESTPLIASREDAVLPRHPSRRPFPRVQFGIIIMLLFSEPMAYCIIFPFLPQLVTDLGLTKGNPASTGYYVGIFESLFFVTQGISIFQWGRLSDRIGRRPVLTIGVLGLAASMFSFGLSTTFLGFILSRAIAGLLNGNSAVTKTMMGEITNDSNRARAFSMIPVTWTMGATLAPLIGGALQHPAERFPHLFGGIQFFITYPYFLPCAVGGTVSVLTWIVCIFCLKESNPVFVRKRTCASLEGSEPTQSARGIRSSMREIMVRPVLVSILNYGILANIHIAYYAVLSVFFAVPLSSHGLGLSPPIIGLAFSALGLVSGVSQVLWFPMLYRRLGGRRLFMCALLATWPLYAMMSIMHMIAVSSVERYGKMSNWVWVALAVMISCSAILDMGFSTIFMFVTAASPSPALLGTTNGAAQTLVSFGRVVGPLASTTLFSYSVEQKWAPGGYGGFLVLSSLTLVALGCASLLPTTPADWKQRAQAE
ncbi:hypothetical protein BS47DRAFT_1291372 [Hydnum rufescens UP504]|uniref:Major facilitator superfamily (MFS) profile domain-containing protein n=1 Tax=Hydnum rufescens UP504 TaxID=1448309 RepID=A0A9P6B3Q8_9AGAM|nr:hypothetical protein BS47DRAFT_1291372 [Hydnum rufescens UP504]